MKLRLKYFVERMLQMLLQVFRVFPIQQNRVLFSAFSGRQYSDSPKRISDELLRTHPEYQQIWAFTQPEDYAHLQEKGITVVRFKSLRYLYYAMTCKVFVDNVEFWSILKFRPGQQVVQTWHGGGLYKRVGSDRLDVGDLERKHVVEKMRKNTLFISSNKGFTKEVIRGAFAYNGEVLEVGLPRNDELMRAYNVDALREELHIPAGNRVVLYAPTFRKNLELNLYDVAFSRLQQALHSRFGGNWTVVLRLHYYMADQIMRADAAGGVIDASRYPDMQPLLQLADVLVTDYSSSMWDFSLMKKPCFIYANDLAEYCTERNFYLPIEQWPFPVAKGNDSLEDAVLTFDQAAYEAAVDEHHKLLGSTETGRATQAICEKIESWIKEEA